MKIERIKRLFKLTKSNILAIILVLGVVVIATAGGSIAYFTDDREMTNVFTIGGVYISLTEAAVKSDAMGNLIEDTDAARIHGVAIDSNENAVNNYGVLFPGKVMHKDPTITNTGNDAAWVAAKVILTDGSGDINKLYGFTNSQLIDIKDLLSGALLDETMHVGVWNGMDNVCYNENYAMVQVADATNGVYEFYFFINAALLKDESVELFDTMSIDPMFGNAEMQEMANLEITVQAFAVQTFGFESCYAAMCQAFPNHFAKVTVAPQQ